MFLSSVCENCAIAGGTLRRWLRMTFWRWRRTYCGHLTKRVRSVWGRMSWPALPGQDMIQNVHIPHAPIPKFLGRDSKRGFFCAFELGLAKGAEAGFLPVLEALGGWSLRRNNQHGMFKQHYSAAAIDVPEL